MAYFFQSIYFKLLIIALTLVGLFEFMVNGGFSDAILNFCFGGIVPGSNHVLDPETVIIGVTITIGLAVAGMLVTVLVRMIAVRKATTADILHVDKAAASELTHGQTVVLTKIATNDDNLNSEVASNSAVVRQAITKQLTKFRHVWVWYRTLLAWLYRGSQRARQAMYQSSKLLLWLFKLTAKYFLYTIKSFVLCTISGLKVVHNWRVQSWVVIKPYAMRFDTWLEGRYQAAIKKTALQLKYFEVLTIISFMARDCFQAIRRYSKSKLKSKAKV